MSRNSVALGLFVRKDCCTLASDPLRVSSRFRMFVRLLPIKPGINAVSMFVTGVLPAPPLATGRKFTELAPVVDAHRNSAPPLNVCFDLVQLTESPYVHIGLTEVTVLHVLCSTLSPNVTGRAS